MSRYQSVQYCTSDPIENLRIRISVKKIYDGRSHQSSAGIIEGQNSNNAVAPPSSRQPTGLIDRAAALLRSIPDLIFNHEHRQLTPDQQIEVVRWQQRIMSPKEIIQYYQLNDVSKTRDRMYKDELDAMIAAVNASASSSPASSVLPSGGLISPRSVAAKASASQSKKKNNQKDDEDSDSSNSSSSPISSSDDDKKKKKLKQKKKIAKIKEKEESEEENPKEEEGMRRRRPTKEEKEVEEEEHQDGRSGGGGAASSVAVSGKKSKSVSINEKKRERAKQKVDALRPVLEGLPNELLARLVFTYVDGDKFLDPNDLRREISSSQGSSNPLLERVLTDPAARNRLSPSGAESSKQHSSQVMHIMAAVGGFKVSGSVAVWEGEEYTLCTVRAFQDGSFIMRPGLSNDSDESSNNAVEGAELIIPHAADDGSSSSKSVREYKLTAFNGDRFLYTLELDNERPRNKKLELLRQRAIRQMYERSLMLRQNLVGTGFQPPPSADYRFRLFVSGEIVSAQGFLAATRLMLKQDLMVSYCLDLPVGWVLEPGYKAAATSHIASTAPSGDGSQEDKAHFGFPFEFSLLWQPSALLASSSSNGNDPDSDAALLGATPSLPSSTPLLYPRLNISVASYDKWDRHEVEGYGNICFTTAASSSSQSIPSRRVTVRTWRPKDDLSEKFRAFFIGGNSELKDVRAQAIPHSSASGGSGMTAPNASLTFASKYGFVTEPTGSLTINYSTIIQSRSAPVVVPRPASSSLSSNRSPLASSRSASRSRMNTSSAAAAASSAAARAATFNAAISSASSSSASVSASSDQLGNTPSLLSVPDGIGNSPMRSSSDVRMRRLARVASARAGRQSLGSSLNAASSSSKDIDDDLNAAGVGLSDALE